MGVNENLVMKWFHDNGQKLSATFRHCEIDKKTIPPILTTRHLKHSPYKYKPSKNCL